MMNIPIEKVREFWDEQPLFVGEGKYSPETIDFFQEHRQVCIEDCFAGKINPRNFCNISKDAKILDLGCGIGFWLVEFYMQGFHQITGADLSMNSVNIAKKRLELYKIDTIKVYQENAENLKFDKGSFDHVNCQGVIHHTPNPEEAVQEIYRVLNDNGTAVISVYYKNMVLRNWSLLKRFLKILKPSLKGRGREKLYNANSLEEIVRQYDGAKNPVGLAFSKKEFEELLSPFEIVEMWYGFFPARGLKFKLPKFLHVLLEKVLPFMIYARVRKRC